MLLITMNQKRLFEIRRKDIAKVQFIIEGYEGMATVTTVNSQSAVIQIFIMPDYIEEIGNLLEELKIKYCLEEIKLLDEENSP